MPGSNGWPAGGSCSPGPGTAGAGSAGGNGAIPGVKSGGRRLRCQRHGARTWRCGRQRNRRAGHVRRQLTGDGRGRYARRRLRPMGIRRRRGHVGAVGPTAAVVRPVRVVAVGPDAEIRARQRVLGPGQTVGRRRVRARRARAGPRGTDSPGCPRAASAPAAVRRWGSRCRSGRGTGKPEGPRCARTPRG